jgi:troponin T
MSDEEHSDSDAGDAKPSEAELALKKRREATRQVSAGGLDDDARELLETNRKDRERMEEEIEELRKRNTKRKAERAEEEKRLAAERAAEEERRKAVDEAKRKQKEEEEQKRRAERESRKAMYDKLANANRPNFVISKREGEEGGEGGDEEGQGVKKSKEQLEKEKRAILKQRIQELKVDGMDQSGLAEKAKELHKSIVRLESEKYDLEKRFKNQQIDMMELAERARQANKVGRDGLKRINPGEGESDRIQERFAGTPAKIEMFSKYERQKDKRNYSERKTVHTGPQYILPPERIPPTKYIKWGEDGMPQYHELPAGGHPPPAAEPAAETAGGEE